MRHLALFVIFSGLSCTPKEFTSSVNSEMRLEIEHIETLRSPEDAFLNIPDFDYPSHFAIVDGDIRMHYLDINSGSDKVIVLLHGEPAWGYTFRNMIPLLLEANYRIIIPDIIGFGKSDKLVKAEDYTLARHVQWLKALLFGELHLDDINFYMTGWGGMIGLRIVGEVPERFHSVIVSNTGLPTGDEIPGEALISWQEESQTYEKFPVEAILQAQTKRRLPPDELAAYSAPFPDESYTTGIRSAPMLVPVKPDDPASQSNRKAWASLLSFEKPFLTIYSARDMYSTGWAKSLKEKIPGARNQPHMLMANTGHFIVEDDGEDIALYIISFIANAEK